MCQEIITFSLKEGRETEPPLHEIMFTSRNPPLSCNLHHRWSWTSHISASILVQTGGHPESVCMFAFISTSDNSISDRTDQLNSCPTHSQCRVACPQWLSWPPEKRLTLRSSSKTAKQEASVQACSHLAEATPITILSFLKGANKKARLCVPYVIASSWKY